MERVIKFRGKRVDTGEWIYGGYHLHNDIALCIATKEQVKANIKHLIVTDGMADWNMSKPINCFEVIPESVGQFTGLTDKNGKDIYEGDIILTDTIIQYVDYNIECACYGVRQFKGGATMSIDKSWEIIGNLYENKELIEKGE